MMTAGILLIAAAFSLAVYNLHDEKRAETEAEKVVEQLPEPLPPVRPQPSDPGEQEIPDYILNPDMEMPVMEIDGNGYIGTLTIPSLGLSLPVMSEWSYPKLRIAPCRYTGSAYQGNLTIAAHNYRTHFGRLDELAVGDLVEFTDIDGNEFSYKVDEVQILAPTAIEEMIESDWDLSLFTCTLGGRTRLTVRCRADENVKLYMSEKQGKL